MADNNLSEQWKEWFHENGTRLLLFARGKTNSEQDAKDVLQESILRLWKSYSSKDDGTFHPPPIPLAFTAVRNTAIDFARKTGRRIKREQNSEQLVQDALTKLMENRTSIVIAHRLSTIKNADEIVVLHEGEIVEQGTHDALLNRQGHYYKLHKMQNIS